MINQQRNTNSNLEGIHALNKYALDGIGLIYAILGLDPS